MSESERASVLALAAALPAATLYEAAGQVGDMSPAIRAIHVPRPVAGFARTVRVFPGDNLGVFHAFARAEPGDVLVIDAGGTDRVTVWGGTSTIAAQARGAVGCVTNAAVRDVEDIVALEFPVFAAGVSVRGAAKRSMGRHQEPVCIGDVVVHAGDLVVGDHDGLVVVAQARIAAVLAAAHELHEKHVARDRRLREGASIAEVMGLHLE
jgi:4-hydroxy-4-methyl-2-oxoglutarate aldolase